MRFYPLVDEKPKSCEVCPFYTETLGEPTKNENGSFVSEIINQCNLTFYDDKSFESCPLIEIGKLGITYVE